MKVSPVLFGVLLMAACSPSPPVTDDEPPGLVQVFDGDLVSLDGQDVRGSNLSISLEAGGDDKSVPNHYFLGGGCSDHGFLDAEDGRFWSGRTPSKNGDLPDGSLMRRRSEDCLAQDVGRYHNLVSLMEEGATLTFDEKRTTATLTTPSNRVAEFRYNPSMAWLM